VNKAVVAPGCEHDTTDNNIYFFYSWPPCTRVLLYHGLLMPVHSRSAIGKGRVSFAVHHSAMGGG
jgi:hypothetical protein